MNIFVTGASGFIGRCFIKHLLGALNDEDRVFALLRREMPFEDERIVPLAGTLEKIDDFTEPLNESDYVFHFAGDAVYGDGSHYAEMNVKPVQSMTAILKSSAKLKKFVFTSTIGAVDRQSSDNCTEPLTTESIPRPTSDYGRSKLKAEEIIIESGLPHVILRPTWVYGAGMRANSHINTFVSMVYRKALPVFLKFPGRVSLIHVDDVARALVNCIKNTGALNKIYFAEIETRSIGEIFRIIYQKVHNNVPFQIPMPRFKSIISRLHSWLPLALSNLFIDYLWAKDDEFRRDLLGDHEPKRIEHAVEDVIEANIHNTGYWVITGANSGIGLALANQLDGMHKKLILIDKSENNLNHLRHHEVLLTDLSDPDSINPIAKKISEYRIFCLVNNAGIGFRKNFEEISVEELKKIITINACAPLFLTKALLLELIKNGSVILNVGSNIAYHPLPNMLMYSSTKAFLVNWSESLTYELRKTNTVITFSPSGTLTNFQRAAGVKIINKGSGLLDPEKVAAKMIRSVMKGKKVVILGLKTNILLLICRLLPRRANIRLWGWLFGRLR